jgi:hypothetical protein
MAKQFIQYTGFNAEQVFSFANPLSLISSRDRSSIALDYGDFSLILCKYDLLVKSASGSYKVVKDTLPIGDTFEELQRSN